MLMTVNQVRQEKKLRGIDERVCIGCYRYIDDDETLSFELCPVCRRNIETKFSEFRNNIQARYGDTAIRFIADKVLMNGWECES